MAVGNVAVREATKAGRGLFANRHIALNTIVTRADAITIKALNSERLKDTCYNCHAGCTEVLESSQTGKIETKPLKVCSSCKTARYCSVKCQKLSWSEAHVYECKIFRKLAPRVLPSNVRAVVRLLLLHKAEKLMPDEWDDILSLNDHLKDFEEAGGERWQNLCLSASAAKAYSGTKVDEPTVVRLFGILMTNSFTMTVPTHDPVGVALDPHTALINHSCEYNATVRFSKDGQQIEVVPLRPITSGEEITISYVDELQPHNERQAELRDRYFFTCKCPRCVREFSAAHPSLSPEAKTAYDNSISLLASNEPSVESLISVLQTFQKHNWSPTTYPLPSLRQNLITAYLSVAQYDLAFVHAMIQSFQLDPALFPQANHPLRMVHDWLCVRIMDHISDVGTGQHSRLDLADIGLDFWRRAVMVSLHRSASMGPEGDFSKTVRQRYEEDRQSWLMAGEELHVSVEASQGFQGKGGQDAAYQRLFSSKAVLEKNWMGVQRVIDVVLRREKGS